jgi:hypothetical protein
MQPPFSVLTTHYSQTSRQPYCMVLLSVLTIWNPSKKPRLEHFFRCRNSHCPKPGGFTTEKGLHIHYGKSPHCGAHAAACQAYIRCYSIVRSPCSPSQPWNITNDNDSSVDRVANCSVPPSNTPVVEQTGLVQVESSQTTNQFGIKYTAEQFTETKLLKILNDAAAPHFLYQDILNWASEAEHNKYSFCPTRLERSSQVKYLEKWLHLKPCRPETVKLLLPGPVLQAIQVTRFNFTNQLHALLTDPALVGNLNNLDVNRDDPFAKYVPPSGRLSTVNSGAIYNLAYKNRCKKPNDFLVGIIFACDETKLQKGSKAGSWPLMFTVSILNQKMWNLPIAWKKLGTFLICL